MQPQGSGPLNTDYFTSLTNRINASTSCAELQAAVTDVFTSINAFNSAISSAQGLLGVVETLITGIQALVGGGSASPAAIVAVLQGSMVPWLQQLYGPNASYASKLSALESATAALTAAINAKAASFSNCTISIP